MLAPYEIFGYTLDVAFWLPVTIHALFFGGIIGTLCWKVLKKEPREKKSGEELLAEFKRKRDYEEDKRKRQIEKDAIIAHQAVEHYKRTGRYPDPF